MDSVINEEVTYDLMVAIDEMYVGIFSEKCYYSHSYRERGVRKATSLLPADYVGGLQDGGCL